MEICSGQQPSQMESSESAFVDGTLETFGGDGDLGAEVAHVLRDPRLVLGLWYARCACGRYVTEGHDSRWRALTVICPFARAEDEARRNARFLRRALDGSR